MGVRDAVMIGKSRESCETVFHKNHKDSQEGQHAVVSVDDVGGRYRYRFPISCCTVRGTPKVFQASWQSHVVTSVSVGKVAQKLMPREQQCVCGGRKDESQN